MAEQDCGNGCAGLLDHLCATCGHEPSRRSQAVCMGVNAGAVQQRMFLAASARSGCLNESNATTHQAGAHMNFTARGRV